MADSVMTAGRVMDRFRARMFDVVAVDSIGIGAGVVDILKSNNIPTVGVNVSETPSSNDSRFNRLRDELWWKARQWFEDRSCGISAGIMPRVVQSLLADIQDIRYDYTPTGKIKIEGKDDMKERLGFSPDIGDALCLTFAAEGRYRRDQRPQQRGNVISNWDRKGRESRWDGSYQEVYVR
jgi:hypothetical protein